MTAKLFRKADRYAQTCDWCGKESYVSGDMERPWDVFAEAGWGYARMGHYRFHWCPGCTNMLRADMLRAKEEGLLALAKAQDANNR